MSTNPRFWTVADALPRPEAPFYVAKVLAKQSQCDLAVSNGEFGGLGDVLVFTPLVEEYARRLGRRIRLLSAPFSSRVGLAAGESAYPIWQNNPFISEIIDARHFGQDAVRALALDGTTCCQYGHVIENVCIGYGLSSRRSRPSLFLSAQEQAVALDLLREARRPLIALNPGGKTCSPPDSPWHEKNWTELVRRCRDVADFVQLGKPDYDRARLEIPFPRTTLRQMFSIIWACDGFIGFDSGPMHVAAAFECPSLILWDTRQKLAAEGEASPAVILRWGYSQNRNLMIFPDPANEILGQIERWIRDLTRRLSWTSNTLASVVRHSVTSDEGSP